MFLGQTKKLETLPDNTIKVKDVDDIRVGDKVYIFDGPEKYFVKNHNCVVHILAIVDGQIVYKHWGVRYQEWLYGIKSKDRFDRDVIRAGAAHRAKRKTGRKFNTLEDVAEDYR